jgi:hypothetical protein
MTWASDELRTFINNVPTKVAEIDASLAGIQEQIDILTDLQTAINDGILDVAGNNMTDLLEAKRISLGAGTVRTWGDYGVIHMEEFVIYTINSPGFVLTGGGFIVDGDMTGVYTAGLRIAGSTGVPGNVTSSVYNFPTTDDTTVLTPMDPIGSHVGPVAYEFEGVGWDSDSDIIAQMDAFDDGYDHLTRVLSGSATYGIDDMIAKLNIGKTIQGNNKAKLETVETVYEPFAT